MPGRDEILIHGTCVALDRSAALLKGAPGTGKSDLALRFISAFSASGAALVADDQVRAWRDGNTLAVAAPDNLSGLLEVRGVGIVEMPHVATATLDLIVSLSATDAVPRLPPDPLPEEEILGHGVPVLALCPFEASATAKLKLALSGLTGS